MESGRSDGKKEIIICKHSSICFQESHIELAMLLPKYSGEMKMTNYRRVCVKCYVSHLPSAITATSLLVGSFAELNSQSECQQGPFTENKRETDIH